MGRRPQLNTILISIFISQLLTTLRCRLMEMVMFTRSSLALLTDRELERYLQRRALRQLIDMRLSQSASELGYENGFRSSVVLAQDSHSNRPSRTKVQPIMSELLLPIRKPNPRINIMII